MNPTAQELRVAKATETVCELFLLIAELHQKDGTPPLNQLPGCWEREVPGIDGGKWFLAANGQKQPIACSHNDVPIEPFHCYVEWNGWPAGIFNPRNGTIAAGSMANEDTLCAALKAEIERKP